MHDFQGQRILLAGSGRSWGAELPDLLLMVLEKLLISRRACVERCVIPFEPTDEDGVISDVTAWGLIDTGRSRTVYDTCITTTYSSCHCRHPRTITLLAADFRNILDRPAHAGPLFVDHPANNERRILLLRLLQNALKQSMGVNVATALIGSRLEQFCGIRGTVLIPLFKPAPSETEIAKDLRKGQPALLLVTNSQAVQRVLFMLTELSQSESSMSVFCFCDDSETAVTIQGHAANLQIADRLFLQASPDERSWSECSAKATIFFDTRTIEDFNPLVMEACRHDRPFLCFSGSAWSESIIEENRSGEVVSETSPASIGEIFGSSTALIKRYDRWKSWQNNSLPTEDEFLERLLAPLR